MQTCMNPRMKIWRCGDCVDVANIWHYKKGINKRREGRYEIISVIRLYVVLATFFYAYFAYVGGRLEVTLRLMGSMDYSSVNCMQEARILTVMFQTENRLGIMLFLEKRKKKKM